MTRASWIGLALLLLVAFGIRATSITYGLPFSQSEKEQRNVNTALKMAAARDLNPQQIGKGVIWYVLLAEFGIYYLVGRAIGRYESSFDFARDFFLDHTELYLIDRIGQMILAVLSLWLLFRLCRRWLGDAGGFWALAFGVFSAVHAEISRHASEDMLAVLFVILTLDRMTLYQDSRQLKDLLLACLCSALAASSKIPGGLALVAVLAVLLAGREWRRAGLAVVVFSVCYAGMNPYVFSNLQLSLASFTRDVELRQSATERQGLWTTLHMIFGQMLGYLVALPAILGIFSPPEVRRRLWPLAVCPIVGFLAVLGHGWGIGPLYAMAIWPMLIALAAAGVVWISANLHRMAGPALGAIGIVSSTFFLSGYTPLYEQAAYYFTAKAPAHDMIVWVRRNLPRGESIAAMSGDVWKGRLFLTPDRIRERLDRFKQPAEYAGLEYNLGNVHFYEFMLKVVESDPDAPCYEMRYMDGKTLEEMGNEPRRQAIYRFEDIQPYDSWKTVSDLPERYFLLVEGMSLPPGREAEIRRTLDQAGQITIAFPPFYLYRLK
ncbi:MAG: hypothetical protein A3G34_06360 [Candidatus Lindowbacteria bacterium RIFCSPLOWO2_12_FULL_62_27]|nr:MAG: hypothetical protein A3G34_06360 [Candidatus Lindowbacteria bacterium RIFCSPLOWO2_12_FULL_62_27]OGH58784.1 MAG: hypothetical protein A3I06_09755 [Candidatus Lindowbacteria bacterium RIFCSPLOWO2_02_FULL_62_12]